MVNQLKIFLPVFRLFVSTEHREPVILSNKVNLVDVNNSKPVVIPIGANMTTVINATIIMKCVTEGSPTPTVSWNHNGRLITTGDRHQVNHTALMIENVQLGDAGRYDCIATNRFGRDDESLLLTITGNFGAALFFFFVLKSCSCDSNQAEI